MHKINSSEFDLLIIIWFIRTLCSWTTWCPIWNPMVVQPKKTSIWWPLLKRDTIQKLRISIPSWQNCCWQGKKQIRNDHMYHICVVFMYTKQKRKFMNIGQQLPWIVSILNDVHDRWFIVQIKKRCLKCIFQLFFFKN